MPKDIIPKIENTDEIIQENLLKYTFIAKRHVLRRNQIPMKFRNNLTTAIIQTEKERYNFLNNLNVSLDPCKLKEDEIAQKEIIELYNLETKASKHLDKLRQCFADLKEEVSQCQKQENIKQNQIKLFEKKLEKEQKMHGDMSKTLFNKINQYNKGVKKQKELKKLYDDLHKEILQKRNIYNMLMSNLSKEAKISVNIGEEAIKSCQERENKLNDLEILQESNDTEKRQMENKINTTKNNLQKVLDQNKFLEMKRNFRHNRRAKKINTVQDKTRDDYIRRDDVKQDELEKNKENENNTAFIKYLIHIAGDTDLKTITDNIIKMNLNKENLFSLLLFFEQQLSKMNKHIEYTDKIVTNEYKLNTNRTNSYECQIKSYLEKIGTNERIINEKDKFTKSLQNIYDEVNLGIYGIFQTLKCDPSTVKQFDVIEQPNEYNIVNYTKEMEKKSVELLYKVNCIENSCLTGQNEDPLTSDADSTEDFISKDYNHIEIKMHKFLNMEDNATLPVPVFKLDLGPTQSPCPICVESRFIEDGPCNILSSSEMNINKQSTQTETQATCCSEVIKRLDFRNMNPKVAVLLHDKHNCTKMEQ